MEEHNLFDQEIIEEATAPVLSPYSSENPHHLPLVLDPAWAEEDYIDDGFYLGVPASAYHANPRFSRTPLQEALRSAAHAKERYEKAKEETREMSLGTALHAAILEPEVFEAEYDVAPQCCAQTGSGKRCSATAARRFTIPANAVPEKDATPDEFSVSNGVTTRWYCDQYGHAAKIGESYGTDDEVKDLSEEDAEKLKKMELALRSHETATKYLWGLEGHNEVAVFWTDPTYGLRMKSRYDRFIFKDDEETVEITVEGETKEVGRPVIVDLKSTKNASLEEFQRSIGNQKYHFQATTYIRAASSLGWPRPMWVFVAVEKKPPFGVATYKLKPETISSTEQEVRLALERVSNAQSGDSWESYPDRLQEIAKPRWA